MCAIIGVTRRGISKETLQECFSRTRSRGPDRERVREVGPG